MQGGKQGDEKGERDNLDEREDPEEGREGEQEIKQMKGGVGRGEKGSKEGESKNPAVDPTSVHRDPPMLDLDYHLGEPREGEIKEVGNIAQEVDEDGGEENGDEAEAEEEKCENEEDSSPRLATQLSLHEELRMSSSFANHSDNEDDPEVGVENVEDEAKEDGEGGDEDEEGDGEEQEEEEEEEGDPMSLFLAHKPFCGRLTSSALSKAEEFSETETYSSGFSEDYKMTPFKPVHRHTQTCDRELADISNPVNDLESHFQATPRYKVIFKEIFQVLKQANKVETASRQDARIKQVAWQGSYIDLGKTPDYPAGEASARLPSKEYQRESLKPKTLPTKDYQSLSLKPKTTFTDYSSLPPTSLSSMASMARLKQIQESYASVLRRGIQDA